MKTRSVIIFICNYIGLLFHSLFNDSVLTAGAV